ncbi:hypothetical protein BJX64DRAFT_268704 [Aspergillus heterothallicus]
MPRRACDRCYAIKAKCSPGRGPDTCRRCERLGHACGTNRSMRRVGRPKATRAASSSPSQSSTNSSTSAEDYGTIASPILGSIPLPESPSPNTDPSYLPLLSFSLSLIPQPHPIPSLSTSLSHPSESTIIEFLFSTTHFIPHFIVGPSFAGSMQHSLQTRFFIACETVLEGFVACAAEFAHRSGLHYLTSCNLNPDPVSGSEEHKEKNMARSAHAIRKLRNLQATNLAEVATMLALGTSILTYDLIAALDGAGKICRYLLSQVKPWYGRLVRLPEFDFELNCLVYLDTVDCLIRREVPVLRHEIREEGVVDRYIGLVYSLLPLLYDVCVLGWEVKRAGGFPQGEEQTLKERWESVRRQIADWQPSPPENFTSIYTPKEVISMCTQVNMNRQLGLLLLHRHRYPFGTEDLAGMALAEGISAEVETRETLVGESPFKIGFPSLVAGFELVDLAARERLINRHFNATSGRYACPHKVMRRLLRLVWRERDTKENVSWFDLVPVLPSFGYIA